MEMKTLTVNGQTYTVADPDAAHIDDTSVGDKAWSSKNIVDKLCPAFEVSGAEVSCEPVEGYPLQVVSHIEAVQEGSGDPSPNTWEDASDLLAFAIDEHSCAANLNPGETYRITAHSEVALTGITVQMGDGSGESIPGSFDGSSYLLTMPEEGYSEVYIYAVAEEENFYASFTLQRLVPGNIRPITGHTAIRLRNYSPAGKNLFEIQRVVSSDTLTNNGDGSLTVKNGGSGSGPNTLMDYAPRLRDKKFTEYPYDGWRGITLSAKSSVEGVYLEFNGINTHRLYLGDSIVGDPDYLPEYLNVPVTWCFDGDADSAVISDIQLEEGVGATEYEPSRSQEITVDLGQTVYGGSYDSKTGLLTITKAMLRLTSDMNWGMTGSSNPNGIYTFVNSDPVENAIDDNVSSEPNPVVSSHYKHYEDIWSDSSVSYENAIMIHEQRVRLTDARFTDLDSFKAFLDEENVQLMYSLAEPITVQLEPQEIPALFGENVLSSSTGEVEVSGKVANALGDLEAALDGILAIQDQLMGGGEA